MPPIRSASRAGFTLVEMIVGLAIMAMIASMVTPAMIGLLDQKRREAAVTNFSEIATAIGRFRADVLEYPGQLDQLSSAPLSTDADVCAQVYTSGERSAWKGPYLGRLVPTTGLPVAIGRARNQLGRFPASGTPTSIYMTVDSVVIEDALAINKELDDDGDSATSNSVRWTTLSAADGLVTLTLHAAMGAC
jgi:general secretion pathway protein G